MMILQCLKYCTHIVSGNYTKTVLSTHKGSIFGFENGKVYMFHKNNFLWCMTHLPKDCALLFSTIRVDTDQFEYA